MNENIIIAAFGAMRETRVRPRYRYDTGQRLVIKTPNGLPDFYEVYFSNEGNTADSDPHLATEDGVLIPDSYFQSGKTIYAWAHVYDLATEGTTIYKVTIPILDRARPAAIDPDPEEADIVAQAIQALNREIDDIENAHENAVAAKEARAAAEQAQAAAEQARDAADTSKSKSAQSEHTASNAAESAEQSAESAEAAKQVVLRVEENIGPALENMEIDQRLTTKYIKNTEQRESITDNVYRTDHIDTGTDKTIRVDVVNIQDDSTIETRSLYEDDVLVASLTITTDLSTLKTLVMYRRES